MSDQPRSPQDNQFVDKDKQTVYIQGPVTQITPSSTIRAIDDVKPPDPTLIIKSSRLRRPLSSPGYFRAILLHAGPAKSRGKHRIRRLGKIQIILLSAAAVFLLMGGYFTYVGVNAVRASSLQAAALSNLTNQSSSSSTGADSPGLSTVKITASDLANYVVAPNMPRYLKIPSLGVDARVLSVGLKNGAIGTPEDIYDTAWYNGSMQPGQPGAAVIDGHVSGWTAHGVFYSLKSLAIGDQIQVVRGDGAVLNYKVVKSQIYPANNVNMKAVLSPIINGQQGLNLITCTGGIQPGTSGYNERLVVFATQS